MKVYNSTKKNIIAHLGKIACNPFTRTIGLIFKSKMEEGEFLVIMPCFSIHTFFMKFPIDVLFVDKDNRVVALYENVTANKILPLHYDSFYVIELKAGQISRTNVEKYDIIQINE